MRRRTRRKEGEGGLKGREQGKRAGGRGMGVRRARGGERGLMLPKDYIFLPKSPEAVENKAILLCIDLALGNVS